MATDKILHYFVPATTTTSCRAVPCRTRTLILTAVVVAVVRSGQVRSGQLRCDDTEQKSLPGTWYRYNTTWLSESTAEAADGCPSPC